MLNNIDIKKTDNPLNLNENWGWFIDIDNQTNLQKNGRKNKINTVVCFFFKFPGILILFNKFI